jgi:single-strand DNA-binding protein
MRKMILTGNIRLGRDAEVKYTGAGTAVANLAGCYEYGMKGQDGKRPVQWVDAALFGKQAEAMSPSLKKGTVVQVVINDVHLDSYQSANGTKTKLVGRVSAIEFAPSQPQREPVRNVSSRDDSFDSDPIPF